MYPGKTKNLPNNPHIEKLQILACALKRNINPETARKMLQQLLFDTLSAKIVDAGPEIVIDTKIGRIVIHPEKKETHIVLKTGEKIELRKEVAEVLLSFLAKEIERKKKEREEKIRQVLQIVNEAVKLKEKLYSLPTTKLTEKKREIDEKIKEIEEEMKRLRRKQEFCPRCGGRIVAGQDYIQLPKGVLPIAFYEYCEKCGLVVRTAYMCPLRGGDDFHHKNFDPDKGWKPSSGARVYERIKPIVKEVIVDEKRYRELEEEKKRLEEEKEKIERELEKVLEEEKKIREEIERLKQKIIEVLQPKIVEHYDEIYILMETTIGRIEIKWSDEYYCVGEDELMQALDADPREYRYSPEYSVFCSALTDFVLKSVRRNKSSIFAF